MRKSIAIVLFFAVAVSGAFAACSAKEEDKNTTTATQAGLENADTEFGTEVDEDGNEVDVEYATNKNGTTIAYVIDPKTGNRKTDKNGKEVTIKVTTTAASTTNKADDGKGNDSNGENGGNGGNGNADQDDNNVTPQTTDKAADPTSKELTTIETSKDKVPSTGDSGKKVSFSEKDLQNIAGMLEVPGLYKFSYENKDGVSAKMAVHVAVWMAQREGLNSTSYPSGTIVLDLFKYFGQTVVNFKTNCNDASKEENTPITYNAKDGVFKIDKAEKKQQTVTITRVEYLGNNNYYKIMGSVSGVKPKKVVAIVQKNKLDNTLGFSVKALKWS